METIRVNMTPCEDIKTIHASQNDSEAREWGFELHNNGDAIDSSEVTDQIVFKAYKGGTEQILPENTSTPTTSPFKGDIRYPQGLLTDQEFTYRQSPTESDGLAKIQTIYGNTLVWNQLIRNGNFADTSNWSAESGATLSISNNIATISSTVENNGIRHYFLNSLIVGHKYLIKAELNVPTEYRCVIGTGSAQGVQIEKLISTANTWTEVSGIGTCAIATTAFYCFVRGTTYENVKIRNVMCFDLTQMGLDSITDPAEFASLFPLPYYDYNAGALLSFNGTGVKTVGKNLLKLVDKSGTYNGITYSCADNVITLKGTASGASVIDFSIDNSFLRLYPRFQYTKGLSPVGTYNGVQSSLRGQNADFVTVGFWTNNASPLTMSNLNADAYYFRIQINSGVSVDCTLSAQLEIGNVATDFEPYTSSTLSLPISTYFSNGMKSAGSVYDELTETKAITRVGSVDLGTLDWSLSSSSTHIFRGKLTDTNAKIPNASNLPNALLANYQPKAYNPISANDNGYFAIGYRSYDDVDVIVIIDSNYSTQDSFISHISGQYLYYELATPTETSFTTASLVTENAEIPLSNEDGVLVGKCTEQLSSESGFFDAKIKLADEDGECYSNKIQLHIERSPQ